MKKMTHIAFSFLLLLTFFVSKVCLAVKPMTSNEHTEFVNDIKSRVLEPFVIKIQKAKWIENYKVGKKSSNEIIDVKLLPNLVEYEILNMVIGQFAAANYLFDKNNSLAQKTFEDSIKLCYNHVSDIDKLVEMPLCCRGFSAYVLFKLIKMDIECKYVKCTVGSGELKEDHDVVVYKVNDEWYVCDLMSALISAMTQFYCDNNSKPKNSTPSSTEFLKMPIKDYQTYFKSSPDRKSTRLNSSHPTTSRMPSSA